MHHFTTDQVQFYVDDIDDAFVKQHNWFVSSGRYVVRSNDGKRLHRLLVNPQKGLVVDHIDRNVLNNSRANLRCCTQRENVLNSGTRSDNLTGYKGVSLRKWGDNKTSYRYDIHYNGRRITKSGFETPEKAFEAYCRVVTELHGDYAPNFVRQKITSS